MRLVVIENKDGSVSCLPMSQSREYYERYYKVLTVAKRLWNPYYVSRIKKYYERKKPLIF